MFGRWSLFGIVFVALGLPLAYLVIASDDQMPWLIALGVYFVVAAIIGNWFVFFGGKRGRKKIAR
jgi:membrane protein DedA with SNARE-associated domain